MVVMTLWALKIKESNLKGLNTQTIKSIDIDKSLIKDNQ